MNTVLKIEFEIFDCICEIHTLQNNVRKHQSNVHEACARITELKNKIKKLRIDKENILANQQAKL
jgi:hypothetical protein